MPFTISTQNGTKLLREHNVRDENIVKYQTHIDPNGKFEIWFDIPAKDAYEKFFGDAVREYNDQQHREDRKITDYYKKVDNDERKHTVYEMIVTIGSINNSIDPDVGYKILYQFIKDWDYRNPNLKMIGAYYHADEVGVPHVHVDYIPIAHGFKNGMHTQNSLSRALKEQGIPHKTHTTAQIEWEHRENKALEEICNNHGVDVVHPQANKGVKHLHVDVYKLIQDAKTKAQDIITTAIKEAEKIKNSAIDDVRKNIEEYEDKLLALNKTYDSTVAKKSVEEFFIGIVSSLKSLEDWQPAPVKEKHGFVTLKSEDFHKVLHGYNAKKIVIKLEESILPDIEKKAEEMEKAAYIKAESSYHAKEVSADRRVRAAELELIRCRTKIDDLEKQSDRLRALYHDTRDDLDAIMPILNKFPEMWEKMRKKARRAIDMEELYNETPLSQDFDFEGVTYTRQQFVDEYILETRRNNIEADNIIIDNLTADASNRETLESKEDLAREHSL